MAQPISKGGKALILGIIILIALLVTDSCLNTIYSKKYAFQIAAASKNYKVEPFLVASIIKSTSQFDENYRREGKMGLMGLTELDASLLGKLLNESYESREQLYDPTYNIALGTLKLSLISAEEKSIKDQIVRYFYGLEVLKKWRNEGENYLDTEESKEEKVFVKKVYKRFMGYKKYRGTFYDKLVENI